MRPEAAARPKARLAPLEAGRSGRRKKAAMVTHNRANEQQMAVSVDGVTDERTNDEDR